MHLVKIVFNRVKLPPNSEMWNKQLFTKIVLPSHSVNELLLMNTISLISLPEMQAITFDVAVTIRITKEESFRRDEEGGKREEINRVTERGEIKGSGMKIKRETPVRDKLFGKKKKNVSEEDEVRQMH